MAAVDVAFKATCATLFATALASGAWLTASMIKGYNDAQEYQRTHPPASKEADPPAAKTT